MVKLIAMTHIPKAFTGKPTSRVWLDKLGILTVLIFAGIGAMTAVDWYEATTNGTSIPVLKGCLSPIPKELISKTKMIKLASDVLLAYGRDPLDTSLQQAYIYEAEKQTSKAYDVDSCILATKYAIQQHKTSQNIYALVSDFLTQVCFARVDRDWRNRQPPRTSLPLNLHS